MESTNNSPEPQSEQKNVLTKVTPVSKYLAMALFILMPFIGGYIGYQNAPERVIEIEKVVSKTPAEIPAPVVDDMVLASVLGEVAGGHHKSFTYMPDSKQLVEIVSVFKKNQYEPQKVTQSPEEFMLELHKMVEGENFMKIATHIPVQGLLSTDDSEPSSKKEGRSVLSGGAVWSVESIHDLVTRKVFQDVTQEAEKYSAFIGEAINPIRNRIVNAFHDVPTDVSVADVKCTLLTDEATREDIMSAAIVYESIAVASPVAGAEFAKTMYECSSAFGGHGNKIYIQPTKDGSSYQVLAIYDYWWE